MILSNTAMFEALDDGRLVIDPEPSPRVDGNTPYGTTSVDLRLASTLQIAQQAQLSIDLPRGGSPARTLALISDAFEIDPRQGFKLEPGELVLGRTLERIHLRLPGELEEAVRAKPVLAARVEGKSSSARFGVLVHFTAPTIHAAWNGPITLEIMCLGKNAFTPYPGMPVCQLIVEEVRGAPSESRSQFQEQRTPAGER